MKTAIITGITGQDAAYLAKHLLDNNYTVYGTYRRTTTLNFHPRSPYGATKAVDNSINRSSNQCHLFQ